MSDLTFAYYPGCSSAGTSIEYDKSSRAVCKALGITLVDVPDWSCCGSTPAHQVGKVLSAALSARNFSQVERLEMNQTLTPCPSCLKNLHNALEHMEDPEFKKAVDEVTQLPLAKKHSVASVLQIIVEQITPEKVAEYVKKPLTGLKVVPYYGCLMTRPGRSMHFDDEENPTSMDRLLTALGAEVLDFPFKLECCGNSMGIPDNSIVARLAGRILDMAVRVGADAVVAACPLCQMNLDMRQNQASKAMGTKFDIPVFYYTQLMALAFGLDEKTQLMNKLIVDPKAALAKIGAEPKKAEAKSAGAEAVKEEAPKAEEAKEEVGA